VLKRRHPKPKLSLLDKLFWVAALQFWSQWKQSLFLVLPGTIVRWHRAGFRLYWTMLCQARKPIGGGKRISKEIRSLIFQMVVENPTWGAPRIHGELLMLGFDVSERAISLWMRSVACTIATIRPHKTTSPRIDRRETLYFRGIG
jgi:putative transposase